MKNSLVICSKKLGKPVTLTIALSLSMTFACLGTSDDDSSSSSTSYDPDTWNSGIRDLNNSFDWSNSEDTDTSSIDMSSDQVGLDDPFSFFVTSLSAMLELSGSVDGFGGDLGGLEGADNICQTIAGNVGAGSKTWRAFLSVTGLIDGIAVNAIDRIGEGPWYDRNGRLIAENVAGLIGDRPAGDAQTVDDLPDEFGQPLSFLGDSHDILTGSNDVGELDSTDPTTTCNDWTETDLTAAVNRVIVGHSWPRADSGPSGGIQSWMSEHPAPGCLPGVTLEDLGPGLDGTVGGAGGYGGIYCFAL
jgi:hypothetical protein